MNGQVRQRLLIVAVGALLFALLLWHPATRQVIVFILPLGSGYDDLLGLAGLIIGGICLFGWIWTGIPTWFLTRRRGN
jgi:hypothetical protein